MADICTDNRFEVIEKYKRKLIEATNIETSPDEMKVLDSILFRFWQMGWLIDKDINVPTNDCISRQGAIDELTEYGNGRAVYISVEEAVRRMEKLPSALPEAPDIHVGNMVSISAVVDMAGKSEWFESSDAYNDFVWAINALPSAQPERIQNNAVHLCDSCQYTYATCPSHGNDAVFGDGKGNYNICACNKYRPIEPHYDEWCNSCKEYDHEKHCCPRWNKVIRQTLIDARPEKFGHWIDTGSGQECSACGEIQYGYDNCRNFCANCGADMRHAERREE